MVSDDGRVLDTLLAHGRPTQYVRGQSVSMITTIYLDTLLGTWSSGVSLVKIRARNYGGGEHWWFELKRRQNEIVHKYRRGMGHDEVLQALDGMTAWTRLRRHLAGATLEPQFAVRCLRTAFNWPGLRVTLDRHVALSGPCREAPLTQGEPWGRVAGCIVEVKTEQPLPVWLSAAIDGSFTPSFSKSRCALALRDGNVRPYVERLPAGASGPALATSRDRLLAGPCSDQPQAEEC